MSHKEGVYWWIISGWELEPLPNTHYRVVDSGCDPNDALRDYDPCSVNAGPFDTEEAAQDALLYMDLPIEIEIEIGYDRLEYQDFVLNRKRKNFRAERFAKKREEGEI